MAKDKKLGEVKVGLTVAELESLLAAYKLANPAKYAAKEANGEFDKQLRLCCDFQGKPEKKSKK